MVDVPISGLPFAAPIQGGELLPVVQASNTLQSTTGGILRGRGRHADCKRL